MVVSVSTQLYGDIVSIWEEVKAAPFIHRKRLPKITFKTSKQKELIANVNMCVNEIIENTTPTISDLNALLYAAAVYICRARGFTINLFLQVSHTKHHKCNNLDQCQRKINELHGDLSIITEVAKGNSSSRVATKFRLLKRRHKFDMAVSLEVMKCDLAMKLGVLTQKLRRNKRRLSRELNSKNKIQAVNMFAVPVVRYGCGILSWTEAEVSKLDIATRRALSSAGMHHPKADVDRLYVWRSEGGRGLLNLVNV